MIAKSDSPSLKGHAVEVSKDDECFGNKIMPYEWKICIHEVIDAQVISRPDKEAICDEQGSLSYSMLNKLANRLAYHLATLGIGEEVIVPLCFDKSMWNVVSMLAVLKTGAAFVPLDPAAPISRIARLVLNVGARTILCSQQHVALLSNLPQQVVPIDGTTIRQLPQILLEEEKPPSTTCNNLAYVIYTSGSTGEPKATMVEHSAFCSGARAHGPAMLMSSESRVLQFAAHTFDASLVEILTTLMLGGTVCIPSEDTRLNNVVAAINHMRINLAILTPSFVGFIDPVDVPGLKTLILAGEAMSATHIKTWSGINLVNGYGPSECSVAAAVNSSVTIGTEPTNIGHAVGAFLWVVDPQDHNQQVPTGSVGELVVQGPTLARGYYNDPGKTSEMFVPPPAWASAEAAGGRSWRLYKTGDLVSHLPDGSFRFFGRKDDQVKVHGQRVELGEIEHHLNTNSIVRHGLVLLPKLGPFQGHLTAIISLSDSTIRAPTLDILENRSEELHSLQGYLSTRLPAYMVPSFIIFVTDIPLLPSGKLDRKGVTTWIQGLNDQVHHSVIANMEDGKQLIDRTQDYPATEFEEKLRSIWSRVLNIQPEEVGFNRSFLSLSGDSISALQVKGQCTKACIDVSVQDILRSKSIIELAQHAKTIITPVQHKEVLEVSFDLSPIQKLFFRLPNQGQGHFNQSFFLRVTTKIREEDLRSAIETVIRRHSMLRARFSQSVNTGAWEQRLTDHVTTSYRMAVHEIATVEEASRAIAKSQTDLDIVNGPVFAADMFNVDGGDQLLFVVGHHLVLDLVSWRVILEDVEELLRNPQHAPVELPLSFQTWCRLQASHCQRLPLEKVLSIEDIPSGDAEYWGMHNQANLYGDVKCGGFELDSEMTLSLLSDCHNALRTETIDILLSSLIYSFSSVFQDRKVPAIYNEGHGREPSDMEVDLSRTVGWFTTMYPVHVSASVSYDLLETIRRVKDLRHKTPDNGRPYFASRLLTEEGSSHFGHHWPLEVTFNYLGHYQQLERPGALLVPVENMAGEARGAGGIADVGKDAPRFGLFEISAVVVQGRLRFSFTFNRHMEHQDKIEQWISTCEQTMGKVGQTLAGMKPQPTLGDFPLLSLDYIQLETMIKEKLPQIGIVDVSNIENIYPCSSMQEGLLISQTKNTAYYAVQVVTEFIASSSTTADSNRLVEAWSQVVNRHASLRTLFIESVSSKEGLYDQVVLKTIDPKVIQMDCSSERYALRILGEKRAMDTDAGHPPHRFTVCQTSDKKLLCKLEINHAIMDGGSMSIIIRDLGIAYDGNLKTESGPLFSDYITYLKDRSNEASIEYWKTYLTDIEPCSFPILNDGKIVAKELRSLRLDFASSNFMELKMFCDQKGLTISNAFHTAWGLTLRSYTDSDDICFGYLTSGRDAPLRDIEDAVGPFINMLVCRMSMAKSSRLDDVFRQVQKNHMDSLPHSYTSLAEVQHALKLSGTPLFNTALSYRKLPSEPITGDSATFVERLPIYDPTEYNLSINVEVSDEDAFIDVDYWTDVISDGQARNISSTFLMCLQNILRRSEDLLSELDFLSDTGLQQILEWNKNMPAAIEGCVHSVIASQTQMQPTAPAIDAWDKCFTYAELDILSSRLALHLISLDVQPEDFVPTCFDKSGWTIVAMLAVLKAGAAAVPLDATHPKSAIQLRVKDTRARIVLVAPTRAAIFEDMVSTIVRVGEDLFDRIPEVDGGAPRIVQPSNPCFVIYTSGSTGLPKGVVLEHKAIVTSGYATSKVYNFGPHSRVLQFASYTFDNSLAEIFFTVCSIFPIFLFSCVWLLSFRTISFRPVKR